MERAPCAEMAADVSTVLAIAGVVMLPSNTIVMSAEVMARLNVAFIYRSLLLLIGQAVVAIAPFL